MRLHHYNTLSEPQFTDDFINPQRRLILNHYFAPLLEANLPISMLITHAQSQPFKRLAAPYLTILLTLFYILTASSSLVHAQSSSEGIDVIVQPSQVARTTIATPPPINVGSSPDTIGLSEQVIGTLNQSLNISGYFDLLERELYPGDFASEGMKPKITGWFNAGAQGLVKSSFEISGRQIKLSLKLFDIDQKRLIALSEGVDQEVLLPSNPKVIRAHIHRFVNQVIKFYTGSAGFLGSRIAAVRKGSKGKNIVYVSADGRSVESVIRGGGINLLPHLASGQLYFTSFRNGGAHLFTYQRGKVKGISARKGINMGGVLSPNGRLLAAVLSYQGSSDIYLLNPKSGEILRRLTRHKSIDVSPTWSPDGRRIAFVSDRDGSSQIWVMNANGSGKRRITFKGQYNQSPSWSPKGDLIAYTGRDEKFAFDIFTVDPNNPQKLTRLTQNQGKNEEPSFSPDGRHIVFSSSRTGRSELYIMTIDGFTQRQLTRGGGYLSPSWERSQR